MPDPKPKASKLSVTPPAGYTLEEFKASIPDTSDVPAFIRQGIDMSKVTQTPAPISKDDPNSIAYVMTNDPYKIQVQQPDLYGSPIFNHELTHTFQATRNPDLSKTAAPLGSAGPQRYDYGGIEGLKKAKSITHFNEEQQAEIVKDYKAVQDKYLAKVKAGKATPADLRAFYEAHQAYHPLVQQLAAMPSAKTNINPSALDLLRNKNIPTIGLKPEAPGLPDYSVKGLGVAPADPLLGGQSQPTQNVGTRRYGETKNFKNGKSGIWDGRGWVAK